MTGAPPAPPDGSAWPELQQDVAAAVVEARVLAVEEGRGAEVLGRLGVTARSTLGALALHTGGLVLDHGWLRVLGGGAEGLPDLATVNGLDGEEAPPDHLVVALDVLGGVYAVDGGGLDVEPGQVCYWGPDTLEWTGIGGGHTAFVQWALAGGLEEFYADLRWPGWEEESAALALDEGLSVIPPPFTREGQDLAATTRRGVPLAELVAFYRDLAEQLADVAPGQEFRLATDDEDDA